MVSLNAAEILGPGGPFVEQIAGFAVRDGQQSMARAIEEVICDEDVLIAEAGTGTGKTFAYLVPAIRAGKRIIVSTGTKTLQDQLFHRDLPRVKAVLDARIKTALLKGRANYLCVYRLDQTMREARLPSKQEVGFLAAINEWAKRTKAGEIAELSSVPEDASIWPRVTSTSENCLGAECPMFNDCHVVRARRAAQEADLVVVNHHLLFADLAIKREGFGEILPGAQVFILDEAHQIPELAGQFFGVSISARQLTELWHDGLREASIVSGARVTLDTFGRELEPGLRKLRLALDRYPQRGAWPQIYDHAEIRFEVDAALDQLDRLVDGLESMQDRSEGLAACYLRAKELQKRFALFVTRAQSGWVQWYELSERGFNLTATPLDVATPLREFRERSGGAWIFTSATLSVEGAFQHFARQCGMDDPRTLALESPFDFTNNALIYLPRNLPPPASNDYTERVVEAVIPALHASKGRAFLLFTSHRALKRAAEILSTMVEFPLFVQGREPRANLLDKFRQSGNGVLLGAASFWEGVDVQGEALSLVVIDKLPFAAPDDPVLEARIRESRDDGGNPFFDLQIPAAVISLKQGVGRLIRAVDDRGVLMLCDPRLSQAGYGKIFLRSLPPAPIARHIDEVVEFFRIDEVKQV